MRDGIWMCAGQLTAEMAEKCLALEPGHDGEGDMLYCTADRVKGLTLWTADKLQPVCRVKVPFAALSLPLCVLSLQCHCLSVACRCSVHCQSNAAALCLPQ